jgi:glycosyltransferase involved in cell wall biosynthesis
MHILIISDRETRGGAAVSASRLASALCGEGHTVTRLVAKSDQKIYPWQTVEITPSIYEMAIRYVLPSTPSEKFMIWRRKKNLRNIFKVIRPDVINVHNLHDTLWAGWSYPLLQTCFTFAPTVWTLHDMWSFTGRCAYNYDCRKFQTGCDADCPTSTEYPALDPSRIAPAWKERQKLFKNANQLTAVTPSRWLTDEARLGFWEEHRIETIPYGLPLDIFKPVDRQLARDALEIDVSSPCILVAAESLSDRRKGMNLFIDALQHMEPQSLTLITLGANPLEIEHDGVNVLHLGYIDHDRTKVLAYSSADLYLHPALADNLPNTVMEAIACGTPVVGFDVGGIPDMIRPGISGWLASEVSSSALAYTITIALNEINHGDNLQYSCRKLAETEYDAKLQAQRYIALFEAITSDASN